MGAYSIANAKTIRQHLRRKHKSPIQCSRCWIILPSVQELSRHTNEEQRCQQREPQQEGIDQDKMDLIESHWGARWGKIYEIIFPGAPVPDPCKSLILSGQCLAPLTRVANASDIEATTPLAEESDKPSPAAQSFQDFNDYSRIALPLLVEASLQSIVHSKIAPIEEEVRILFVDIVRRSQSTVAQNFQQAQQLKLAQAKSSEVTPTSVKRRVETSEAEDPFMALMPNTATEISADATTHYQEPPFSDFAANPPPLFYIPQTPPKQASDSGYATIDSPCACFCHVGISLSSSINGMYSNVILR